MLDTTEIIKQLKEKVTYDGTNHYMGKWILTSKDMRTMCSHYYGEPYDILPRSKQKKIENKIFEALE